MHTVEHDISELNIAGPRVCELLLDSFPEYNIVDVTYDMFHPNIVTIYFESGEDALAWKLKE